MTGPRKALRLIAAGAVLALQATWCGLAAMAGEAQVTGFVAVTDGAGSLQISSFDLAGGHEKHLTAGPANHHYPTLSSDGRSLLYVGDDEGRDEIYRLALGGARATPEEVTAPPLFAESPTWAPDGRTIAYSAILTGWPSYQIFVAGADGSRPTQLTRDTESGSSQPVFSPDGRHIAYINGHARDDRIWVMDSDGGNARPLTSGPLDAYPAWLGNSTILFAREDLAVHRSTVFAVGIGGGDVIPLSPPSVSVVEPRPMPDGRSYGATAQLAGSLHLVTIGRSDGLPLVAAPTSAFDVRAIDVAATDGSVSTLSWIVTAPLGQARTGWPWVPFALAGLGLAVLVAAVVGAYRRRLDMNERLLV